MLLPTMHVRIPRFRILHDLPWNDAFFRFGLSVALAWVALTTAFAIFG